MEPLERFNLRWNGFVTNAVGAIKEFQNKREFLDVTLVAEDGKQFRANKIVLAGASSLFYKIIKESTDPRPLIYLRGVSARHLQYLLDFMYTGEVRILQDEDVANDFLDMAVDLRLKAFIRNSKFLFQRKKTNDNQTKTPTLNPTPPHNYVSFGKSSSSHHQNETSSHGPDHTMDKPVQSPPESRFLNGIPAPQPHKGQVPAQEKSQAPIQSYSPRGNSSSSKNIFLQAPCQKDHEDTNIKVEAEDETAALEESHPPAATSSINNGSFSQAPRQIDQEIFSQAPPQIDQENISVKLEVCGLPVGYVSQYKVHYELNKRGEQFISDVSLPGLDTSKSRRLSRQKKMKDGTILAAQMQKEDNDDYSSRFNTERVSSNNEENDDWYDPGEDDDGMITAGELENGVGLERSLYSIKNCDVKIQKLVAVDSYGDVHNEPSPEIDFQCSFCNKTFAFASQLKVHLRRHTGERPYHCTQCPKTFSHANRQKEHMRSHTGERPFICSQCAKTFSRSENLKIHMRSHTGEKPYHCSQCPKSFSQLSNLNKHKRSHTSDKP